MKKSRIILWSLFLALIFNGCSINKNTKDKCTEPITVFEYNNAYYEYFNIDYLKENGLYKNITTDDLGNEIFVLPSGVISHDKGYDNCKVYEYTPVNSNALVVVDKNGEYQVFGFCNFIDDKPTDGIRILEVYNVTDSNDIITIEEISPYEKNFLGTTTPKILNVHTDRKFIERFYTEYKNMIDVGNETYQNDAFSNVTEEQWQSGYDEYLKNQKDFHLTLKNGLKIKLSFYPEIRYMRGYVANYKISDEFSDFLEN